MRMFRYRVANFAQLLGVAELRETPRPTFRPAGRSSDVVAVELDRTAMCFPASRLSGVALDTLVRATILRPAPRSSVGVESETARAATFAPVGRSFGVS